MTTTARRGILAVVLGLVLLAVGAVSGVGVAAETGIGTPERDAAVAWIARALLVLAGAWLLIGMIAARTRLVARPGAAAARATWLAATRPWRARESTLGMLPLDRLFLVAVPGALFIATRALQSALTPTPLALAVGTWVVFVGLAMLLLRGRSPWALIAAVGGVLVLRCTLTLAALALTGPGEVWAGLWASGAFRGFYVAVAAALVGWTFVAAGWALAVQLGARRAVGVVLTAAGAALVIPAATVALIGVDSALRSWSDQLGLLPWSFSRIIGTTAGLEVPPAAAWAVTTVGLLVAIVGLALLVVRPARVLR